MAGMTNGKIASIIDETQGILDTAAALVEGAAPNIAPETEIAVRLVDLASQVARNALTTIGSINGQPITPEMIQALSVPEDPLPDPDPAPGATQ